MNVDYERHKARALIVAIWDQPDDPRHGTVNGYNNLDCRCDRCTAAWAAWFLDSRKRRASRLAPDDPRHGRASTYFNHACRCDACKKARASFERERRHHNRKQAS